MICINNFIGIGRLTRDPELRYIPGSGAAVTKFNIAIDKGLSKEKKQELEAKNEPTADFLNVVTWGKTAEAVANFTQKGKLIAVQGKVESGKYVDKEGKTIYTTEIKAFNVEFLEWKDKDVEPKTVMEVVNNFGKEVRNGTDDIPF